MTLRHFLVMCLILAGTVIESSAAPQSIGTVNALEGKADAVRDAGSKTALNIGDSVYLKNRIVTRAKSKITIEFLDQSTMSQGENSEMVLDELVYNPARKSDNAFKTSLVKGVFRCITGRIVEMNPKRFSIKTGRATIGIRGSDIGFEIDPVTGDEKLLIFDLHRQLLEVTPDMPGVEPFVVSRANILFEISGKGVQEKALTKDAAERFINKSAPKGSPPPGGPTPSSGVKMDMPPWLENR